MTQTTARNMFVVGTVFFSIVFLYLTYDSLKQMPRRTNEDKLTEKVVAGKHVWQDKNCNDCHTILGIGGYYAPDITKVAKYRDRDWLTRFLKDPEGVWPAKRKMPNLHLSDMEVDDLIAFMTWVSNIDTNNWPPKPMMFAGAPEVSGAGALAKKGAEGERLFALNGCQSCHMVNGVGGKVGPDLTHVGSRLPDVEWHIKHLRDPASVHPGSAMPAFGSLPDEQIEALAEYLAGLK
jgi:nitric oxide reductase subunit C